MDIWKRVSNEKGSVRLGGRLTIPDAQRLSEALRDVVSRSRSVRITFTEVQEADLSVVQLLCAAHKTMASSGKELSLVVSDGGQVITEAVEAAGLTSHLRCNLAKPCIWEQETKGSDGGAK
jgi:anti-anti-sigma regulatory factor